jgi:hypothetical protein
MDFVEVMELRDGLIQKHRVHWAMGTSSDFVGALRFNRESSFDSLGLRLKWKVIIDSTENRIAFAGATGLIMRN